MKKVVFAALLVVSSVASAQWSFDLPNLWWPEEFVGGVSAEEMQMITTSQNVKAYMAKNQLTSIQTVIEASDGLYVVSGACTFKVVIRQNQNPAVRPVANTLSCDE